MKWNAANLYDVHLLVLYLASKYFCRRVEGGDYFPIARDSLTCLAQRRRLCHLLLPEN